VKVLEQPCSANAVRRSRRPNSCFHVIESILESQLIPTVFNTRQRSWDSNGLTRYALRLVASSLYAVYAALCGLLTRMYRLESRCDVLFD
jgi:hypothetical protein